MRKSYAIILAVIILSFGIGIYFYPQLPEIMASHWNIEGRVDDYISRFWGVFLMPVISIVMFLLFVLIPRIDPLKANIEKFRKYFDNFIILIILFLFYIYLLTIFWNLGYKFDMSRFLVPAMGLLFYYAGVLIENAKRNWFIGIRTPWTLSSDLVWDKTHKLGGRLFKICGIIAFLGIVFPRQSFWLLIVPLLAVTFYTLLFSYFEYKKEIAAG